MKRDLIKICIVENYKTSPEENNPTNKVVYNFIDERWFIALADMIDYKI